jgi:hypothetical protein
VQGMVGTTVRPSKTSFVRWHEGVLFSFLSDKEAGLSVWDGKAGTVFHSILYSDFGCW